MSIKLCISRIFAGAAVASLFALSASAALAQSAAPDISAVAPASAGKELRAAYIQSDGIYMHNGPHGGPKQDIPYKKSVRIVSNLFEFPDGWDPVAEKDMSAQFHEYLFAKYPAAIEKLRGHNPSEGVQTIKIFKGREKQQREEYAKAFVNYPGREQWDIIYVEGFKYAPRTVAPGWHPATLKARALMSGVKPQ